MLTTLELLDALKSRQNINSDYAIAKYLGVTRQAISGYRKRQITFSDEMAIRIADALKISRGYVLACMQAQRANCDELRQAWESVAGEIENDKELMLQ